MLDNLPVTTLPNLLRRTTVSALIAGCGGFIVAAFLGSAFGALGVALGLVLSFMNLRFLLRQVNKVEARGEQTPKEVRRQLGGRTLGRLMILTAIAGGGLLISAPLGIGIVSGLVLYQIMFVLNVFRVIVVQGVAE